MSTFNNVYLVVRSQLQYHIDKLVLRLNGGNSTEFTRIHAVELVINSFVSCLAFFAALYELFRYFTLYVFTDIITLSQTS